MKPFLTFYLALCCTLGLFAQKSFDPDTDTIALTDQRGVWKIIVSEKVLITAAQFVTPNLIEVEDVRVQDIHSKPYLFFRGMHRERPAFGYTIMVQLIETDDGIWKAGNIYQGCWGDTCSACGFDEYWGCACERYDGELTETTVSYCNHMIALGMGLAKVVIPD